ncbi:MAG TPA: M23 family metallopeptidase [Sedimenticola thiotaurini]|uniref:M23 family metallopeptidase n=1 Tax=Sedimenticola thiotaurini TaxID=1543721 RepID=A0A831RLR5_9GAMM|nr:M23 family metallopeptidase [Sedimenticola thiotaurini]
MKDWIRSLALLLAVLPAWAGALELEGELVQGGVVTGRVEPGTRVLFDGERIRVSEEGVFLLGFGRDHPATSRLELIRPDGGRESRTLEVRKRNYAIQRVDGLPKRKVTPKKIDYERIRREAALVRKARQRDDPRTDFLTGWIWPVEGPISGVYGSQRILNGKPRRPHYGVDIARPVGTPVRAPADGIVTLVHPDMFYSGVTLIIDHGHGLSSSFLHLKRTLVKPGQRVRRGQVVAEVGRSGRVTGAHLDWRMNLRKARVDPQLLAGPMPQQAGVRKKKH